MHIEKYFPGTDTKYLP